MAAGEQLWGVTDQPSFWVVVLEGQLETRRHGYTIEELVAGSACGFLFLLVKGRQRETDLVAVQASRALLVTARSSQRQPQSTVTGFDTRRCSRLARPMRTCRKLRTWRVDAATDLWVSFSRWFLNSFYLAERAVSSARS